ncbi:similar to Saccharomyces cerevisiae YKL051W SFK1 Plasma membrane protein that may act together with or upstream of Stt4p to generate normal levels of the essential phospholipid PI4P [Maudiozyma saulgeensis]|uniref:Similar to Saccharomyces cerevisiae YKL051W SFK1 Plasma membrane protein that may act together with or upstream of Stt4p to generate normal levels of the essential phospholipid PI4P n=1 Tax=Maudiozyma saulgeensis TaxID=1789683 RepID=A0A1X7R8H0_9SACH|nr:similar to Saccharomyces cerevisiae YKL051W SFK1 Plasma membrane protein that may act together with or upstream of Stt4p to generate normal levels of the essential phospholipid PI4P [Kazachstania saulgeensis]
MHFVKPGNWFFILPWIAFIPWYGMLIAMLICWGVQGRPIYDFMDNYMNPVYISDIGATNLRPLFIACSAWQGIGYCLSVLSEYYQRGGDIWLIRPKGQKRNYYMSPWYTIHERNLIFAACFLGMIGELGLFFCTIFSTKNYPHVHISMVCVFVVLLFFSVCCLSAQNLIMGKHYALLHPLANLSTDIKYEDLRWNQWQGYIWNKHTITAIFKIIWLILAVVWAICFGAIDNDSRSADFEWLLAFWFGFLFIIISVDFYIGSRYKVSKYFNQIDSFEGFYKFEEMFNSRNVSSDDFNSIEPKETEDDQLTA